MVYIRDQRYYLLAYHTLTYGREKCQVFCDRVKECQARSETLTFEAILAAMRKRDKIDSTRDVAPLRAAADAIILDSDGLSIEQVLERMKDLL